MSAAAAVVLVVGAWLRASASCSATTEPPVLATPCRRSSPPSDAQTKTVETAPWPAHRRDLAEPRPDGGRDRRAAHAERAGRSTRCGRSTTARATSVGVVENLKAGKAMAMPSAGTTVAITIEPAGGSEQPTSKPIVTVDPAKV